ITGSVMNARLPDRFSLPEHATNGAVLGVIESRNTAKDRLDYTITAGNTGGTFVIDNLGTLSVVNNSLLDYVTLGTSSQFPPQFELFVNLMDETDPLSSETNRRVVVAGLYVPSPQLMIQQSQSLAVLAGSNVSFSVLANRAAPFDSPPFLYQWFFGGSSLPGEVDATLGLTNVQSTDSGGYWATVSSSVGSV